MNVDVGSPVLDVALGLSLVFFLLSLIVTAVTEGISWALSKRANDLEAGLRSMLGEDYKESLLDHPLVKAGVKEDGKVPAYISPRTFSLALLNLVAPAKGKHTVLDAAKDTVDRIDPNSPLKKPLASLIQGADGDVKQFRAAVEGWFNDSMDRVSGWYKRWAQIIACVIAVVVAVGLNVDTLRVSDRLANDQTVRQAVASQAQQVASGQAPTNSGTQSPTQAGDSVASATNQVSALNLPIGWNEANDTVNLSTGAGWLLTALAISLGAPFWFDTLSKLSRLRTTGAKPPRETD
jgi:hypothetical protein